MILLRLGQVRLGLVGLGRVGLGRVVRDENSDNRANSVQVQLNLPTRAELAKNTSKQLDVWPTAITGLYNVHFVAKVRHIET